MQKKKTSATISFYRGILHYKNSNDYRESARVLLFMPKCTAQNERKLSEHYMLLFSLLPAPSSSFTVFAFAGCCSLFCFNQLILTLNMSSQRRRTRTCIQTHLNWTGKREKKLRKGEKLKRMHFMSMFSFVFPSFMFAVNRNSHHIFMRIIYFSCSLVMRA